MMDEDVLRVSTTARPGGGVTVAVQGYLDEGGGKTLARRILDDLPGGESHIDIDLDAVTLFNCSGARQLLAAVEDLNRRGRDVEIVGVRPPLQRVLDFGA
jgi:anti-anti-sigma factor